MQENRKTVDLRNMQDPEQILHGTGRTLKVLGDSVLGQQPLKETSCAWASPYKPKLFKMGYTARFSQAGKEDTFYIAWLLKPKAEQFIILLLDMQIKYVNCEIMPVSCVPFPQ